MQSQHNFSQLDTLHISPLQSLDNNNSKNTVMVTVLQKSPTKDVLIKHGLNTGNTIKLASILTGDQSDFYVTISLWGEHAIWVNRLNVGDIIVLTNVIFSTSKNRKVGRTTKNSTLMNFKVPRKKQFNSGMTFVNRLLSFYNWLTKHHSYLYSPIFQTMSPRAPDEMMSSFSQIDEGQMNLIQATVTKFSKNEPDGIDIFCGSFDLEDCSGSKIMLNVRQSQWNTWVSKIGIQENLPTVKITNVLQCYCKAAKCFELFASHDSVLEVVTHTMNKRDLELTNLKIECVEFYDENGLLKCRKNRNNIADGLDLEKLLYKSCDHCFYPICEGTANHNKSRQTIRHCPHCSKVYKRIYMFTQLQIEFRKTTPKHFGEVSPRIIKALSPYRVNLELFPNFVEVSEDTDFTEDLFNAFTKDMNQIFSKNVNLTISKLDKAEEDLYMLHTESYIIKKISYL